MDISYVHLIQLLLMLLIICGAYGVTVSLPGKRVLSALLMGGQVPHPVYIHFCQNIVRENLFAYEKYQIWRYIERRKGYPISKIIIS